VGRLLFPLLVRLRAAFFFTGEGFLGTAAFFAALFFAGFAAGFRTGSVRFLERVEVLRFARERE